MALLSLRDGHVSFGGAPLLDEVSFHIEHGDRICLLGSNGAGKSTMLQVLAGVMRPDRGEVIRAGEIRVGWLPQQALTPMRGRVRDVVGASREGEATGGAPHRTDEMLSRLHLDPAADVATLSGGMRRRVLLARALFGAPEMVLLDEPTNHLDLEAIDWLETYLLRYCRTFLFVTHDRSFLRRLASRVVELDRGRLIDWRCDYDTFLRRKAEWLNDEARRNAVFDRRLAREEAWRRQGVKARAVRNQGRLRALESMREERRRRRARAGSVQMEIQEADRTGHMVLKAENVSFGYDANPLIRDASFLVGRGDKVGILGPNGCGKTTLLRLLLGVGDDPRSAPEPHRGHIARGTNFQVAYADQMRAGLDDARSLVENLADGREFVTLDGQRRHVIGYLGDFEFPPDRARQPVGSLSGGERNRFLLARLFAQPSNVLALDEPTNDLDLDTLELLEDRLVDYRGTVLLVSHDRTFLNRVVTHVLAFEKERSDGTGVALGSGDGWYVNEYVGGYDDWKAQRPGTAGSAAASPPSPRSPPPSSTRKRARRLTLRERSELDALPARIETLESERVRLHAAMADPELYRQQDGEAIAGVKARSEEVEREIESAYLRWQALEAIEEATSRQG